MKKKELCEPRAFGKQFKLIAADLSLKRPGFAFITVLDGKILHADTYSIDNKKSKLTHNQILRQIGEFTEQFITSEANSGGEIYFVREKSLPKGIGAMSTMTINEVVGVTNYIFAKANIEGWEEIYPNTVKKLLTGNGKAEKDEVATKVKEYIHDIEFNNDDESDACAVGIAWLIQNGVIDEHSVS